MENKFVGEEAAGEGMRPEQKHKVLPCPVAAADFFSASFFLSGLA